MTTETTTTPTFTDEQRALAAGMYSRYWGDVFHQLGGHDAHLPAGHELLWAYEQGVAAQPGWRETTRDEITQGMRVRVETYNGDRVAIYEGIADREPHGEWVTTAGWGLNTCNLSSRFFTPCADSLPRELGPGEVGKLPAGARFQVITAYRMGDPWVPEGDPTYRLLSLPEANPDPVLVDLIGEDAARKIAAAGLVCEPRARQ